MKVVFLTGIWPPDVGGPATHGPDFSRFLVGRGHEVRVITMGDVLPTERPCPVSVVPRRLPFPIRYGLVSLRGAREARRADVVYASATLGAAALASFLARRPLVAKLTSDPAYERARRYGLFAGDSVAFQSERSRPVRLLKTLRNAALRRARTIVVPSAFLAEIAARWGLDARRIIVLTNPAPPPREVEPETLPPGTFVFVGRLTEAKDLPTAFRAVELVEGSRLVVVGDGPDREALERLAHERIEFRGVLPRDDALRVVAGATAALLSSAWENLPHSAVEALSVGVPVVATAVGGVPEVVHDGENGLLVPPGDPEALAAAMRRVLEEPGLCDRLATGAKPSVEAISSDAIYTRLEALLAEAVQ